MAENPIPFAAGEAAGLEEAAGASPALINLLVAADGHMRLRPGIKTWADYETGVVTDSPVIGLTVWKDYLIFVTADRRLWAWLGVGDVVALSDTTAATQLDGTEPPRFASDRNRVVVAGGGLVQKWEGTGLSARLGGSPPNATHIVAIAQRFVVAVNDNTGIIQWTPPGVGNHETWDALSFMEAESKSDRLVALHSTSNELFAFGTETVQVLTPDPITVFAAAQTVDVGCATAGSIVQVDGAFAWLDHTRRVAMSNGRDLNYLSTPAMDRVFKAIATIDDCWAARVLMGSHDLLLFVFPTDGRTFCYDRNSQKWCEWRSYAAGEWDAWIAGSYLYWPDKNLHLVGLGGGIIGQLDTATYQESSGTIRAVARTGFIDHGTLARKHSIRLQLRLKRGADTNDATTPPIVEVRYRDIPGGAWSRVRRISLGAPGDTKAVQQTFALGVYEQRQWELSYTDNAELVVTAANEKFTVLES